MGIAAIFFLHRGFKGDLLNRIKTTIDTRDDFFVFFVLQTERIWCQH